jgi:hypothetical protein
MHPTPDLLTTGRSKPIGKCEADDSHPPRKQGGIVAVAFILGKAELGMVNARFPASETAR